MSIETIVWAVVGANVALFLFGAAMTRRQKRRDRPRIRCWRPDEKGGPDGRGPAA